MHATSNQDSALARIINMLLGNEPWQLWAFGILMLLGAFGAALTYHKTYDKPLAGPMTLSVMIVLSVGAFITLGLGADNIPATLRRQ